MTATSAADRPTLREQLAWWLHEQYGEHTQPNSTRVDSLLALVERAKADAYDEAADELLLSSLPENHWAVIGFRARATALRSQGGGR